MNTSKVAVVANAALGKILSIIGYIAGPLFLLVLLFGLPDEATAAVAVMCLILIAISVLFITKGIQIKRRIKRFKQYIALISGQQMTSLENISASTNQTVDFVTKDLQKMIKMKFFANATIDTSANEIVIGGKTKGAQAQAQAAAQVELEAYTCPGCDATGNKPKGTHVECEYCGTPV